MSKKKARHGFELPLVTLHEVGLREAEKQHFTDAFCNQLIRIYYMRVRDTAVVSISGVRSTRKRSKRSRRRVYEAQRHFVKL
ncbi:hypothetical protein B296_00052861 [Ensete ventricosum]|uniref:Uncharacterized protein n=1 Tax=Ensete ventricosum TaxID=4639 RepID=A0A426Y1K3_ENSVE|nr:hypothetical protein B296_00052861 [Ensete ventricosum]